MPTSAIWSAACWNMSAAFLLEYGRRLRIRREPGFLWKVSGVDYFIDLLFYHLKLRLFRGHRSQDESIYPGVSREKDELLFIPPVDDLLRHPQDAPEHRHHPLQDTTTG